MTDDGGSYIDKKDIDSFLKRPYWSPEPHQTVKKVFIMCDPNVKDSKTSSEMALVAIGHVNGNRVVFFYFFSPRETTVLIRPR